MFRKLETCKMQKDPYRTFKDENYTFEMKNTLDEVNGRLDISGRKINELEGIAIETIQQKHTEKREGEKTSISCRIPSKIRYISNQSS